MGATLLTKQNIYEGLKAELPELNTLKQGLAFNAAYCLYNAGCGYMLPHNLYSDCFCIAQEYKRNMGLDNSGNFDRFMVRNGLLKKTHNHNQHKKSACAYQATEKLHDAVDDVNRHHITAPIVEPRTKGNKTNITPKRIPALAIASKDANGHSRATRGNISSLVAIDRPGVGRYAESCNNTLGKRQAAAMLQYSDTGLGEGQMMQLYRESDSARIYGQGVHLQTCMKELRHAALPGLHNYDVEACHHSILYQLAVGLGLRSPQLKYYIENKKAFRRYLCDTYGLCEKDVKQLMAIMVYSPRIMNTSIHTAAGKIAEQCKGSILADPEIKALNTQIISAANAVIEAQPISRGKMANALHKRLSITNEKATLLSHILNGYETKALDVAMNLHGDIIVLLLHDGFITSEPINTDTLANAVESETGLILTYSHEIMPANNATF